MTYEKEEYFFHILGKYAEIPKDEKVKLSHSLKSRHLEKGDHFVKMGEYQSRFAFIMSGIFRVYCIDESGNEKTMAFRQRGHFLAAYSPIIRKKESWYFIQALRDGEILSIEFKDYLALSKEHPSWGTLEKNYLVDLFIEKEDRERSFLMEDASTRYLNFCKKNPGLEKTVSQFHIASYLGISPVSLSRIRAQIKKT